MLFLTGDSAAPAGAARAAHRDDGEMAIYRLLKDTTFEPEAVEAMGRAYEDLLTDLRLADRNDPFTEIVAKEIVRIASRGVRRASEIRSEVLTVLGKPAGI